MLPRRATGLAGVALHLVSSEHCTVLLGLTLVRVMVVVSGLKPPRVTSFAVIPDYLFLFLSHGKVFSGGEDPGALGAV